MAQIFIETRSWAAAEHLQIEEDMAAYLDAALKDGGPTLVVAVLGDIARARRALLSILPESCNSKRPTDTIVEASMDKKWSKGCSRSSRPAATTSC